ncbi:unnamed protein product [Arctogadus glacialis]
MHHPLRMSHPVEDDIWSGAVAIKEITLSVWGDDWFSLCKACPVASPGCGREVKKERKGKLGDERRKTVCT